MKPAAKLLVLLTTLFLTSCTLADNSSDASSSFTLSTETTHEQTVSQTTDAPTESSSTTHTTEPVMLPPVETEPPNTDYEPAFAGQTRVAGVATTTPYEAKILTAELTSPWAVAVLPDGRLVVTEKSGNIRIVESSGELSQPIGGFPPVDDRSQGGLLDVILSPDYNDSRLLYFTLAEKTAEGSLTAVARGRLSDDESIVEAVEIIWRAIPYYDNSMHFGSRLVFDQAGNLFVTTGERSDLATRPFAQYLDNAYGKVVHITADGEPVADNPFINQDDALPEIYSFGHRNVQGIAIHPLSGDVFISEMGPRGGDELNLIQAGKNYGWPIISYGIEYSGQPISGGLTVKEGMEQPVYYWDPVLAPSGMTFYPYDKIPEWENSLFIAGLRAQHIARLVIDDNRVIAEERLLLDETQRFRDVAASHDGYLYAITDQGRLYRIG
ncbi:MAG: PQQ-dependent sugar dehydrogenase [Clostridiaceae bacterium]|nr:PQQ-dependent sugar dehydrogenase [Clostridiaceae bacterium]